MSLLVFTFAPHRGTRYKIGLWGAYTTIRYFLAFATVPSHTQRVFSLALGIVSAIAVAAAIVSITLPLFHGSACVHTCRQMRSLLRACCLLIILLATATNLALVVIWHPNDRCAWDIDISWYLSAVDSSTTRCDPATFTVWIIAAVLRLLLTSILIVSGRVQFFMTENNTHDLCVCNRFYLCTSFVRIALLGILPRGRSKDGDDHTGRRYPYQTPRMSHPLICPSPQRRHF